MIDELINKQVEVYREKFCKGEELICECGHSPRDHYWEGIDGRYAGYDNCTVEGCGCFYDEDKIYLKELPISSQRAEGK